MVLRESRKAEPTGSAPPKIRANSFPHGSPSSILGPGEQLHERVSVSGRVKLRAVNLTLAKFK